MTIAAPAVVVGGGIAGLAAACGLARAGRQVRVLEAHSDFSEVGTAVALPTNGITALRALGATEAEIDELGTAGYGSGFRDQSGRALLRIPAPRPGRDVAAVWGVHRQRLHGLLLAQALAAGVELVPGAGVSSVDPGQRNGRPAQLRWTGADGEQQLSTDLLVGADGMFSSVRSALYPHARAAYSGSSSWRGLLTDASLPAPLVELWGPEAEFGIMRISPTQVYWYGYVRQDEGRHVADEHAAVTDRFASFAPLVHSVIARTRPEDLMRHDVYHLPPALPGYTRERTVLVGDAAHGALPTMGQGAATALEDGATLGSLVDAAGTGPAALAAALAGFDAERRPRCTAIARQALLMARFGADLRGGWPQQVRNALVRLVPGALVVRSGAGLVGWQVP
ncbi:FAD-dependent monooxygenase [Ruania zhangjianzhongii]|uniref:FAD-dependent monooxygenase n=1 Tax=Ruania zhangjianzhongii TaxID=2603206 RepID=UPI001F26F3C8|nr:FAD-dependent monooxygenase [Ruania zhangjianzhongii]